MSGLFLCCVISHSQAILQHRQGPQCLQIMYESHVYGRPHKSCNSWQGPQFLQVIHDSIIYESRSEPASHWGMSSTPNPIHLWNGASADLRPERVCDVNRRFSSSHGGRCLGVHVAGPWHDSTWSSHHVSCDLQLRTRSSSDEQCPVMGPGVHMCVMYACRAEPCIYPCHTCTTDPITQTPASATSGAASGFEYRRCLLLRTTARF